MSERTVELVAVAPREHGAVAPADDQFRTLVEQCDVGVFTLSEGVITFANPALCTILGYADAEVEGRGIREILAPEERDLADMITARGSQAGVRRFTTEVRLIKSDRSTRVIASMTIAPTGRADGTSATQVGTLIDITLQKRAEVELRIRATHDSLTGLPNRRLFLQRLSLEMKSPSSPGAPVAVMFIDLDGFKVVNDSLGHAMGDVVLKEVAARIGAAVEPADMVARHGSDEFTVLLTGRDEQELEKIALRIHSEVFAPIRAGDQEVYLTTAIGIASASATDESPDLVIQHADIAMYRAKRSGKGEVCIYRDEMQKAARRRLSIESELRVALERGQFEVYYQPIAVLETGRTLSAEALLRWRHPLQGVLSPGEFLGLAEEIGLLVPVGQWMIEQIAAQLESWGRRDPAMRGLCVSVNVSDTQFKRSNLPKQIDDAVTKHGLVAGQLHIELTEQVFITNYEEARRKLMEIRETGAQVYLDDFGTGFSSLNHLNQLPFDKLKLDREFLNGLDYGVRTGILPSIVALAKAIGLKTVAEGIETERQLDAMRTIGVDEGQGYYLGVPMTASEIEPVLSNGGVLRAFARHSEPLAFAR